MIMTVTMWRILATIMMMISAASPKLLVARSPHRPQLGSPYQASCSAPDHAPITQCSWTREGGATLWAGAGLHSAGGDRAGWVHSDNR